MCVWGKRLTVLLVTFFLGVGSSALRNYRSVINLCDIDANNSRYAGKTVRLHEYLAIDDGYVVVLSLCGSNTDRWGSNIEYASVQLSSAELKSFIPAAHLRDSESRVLYEVMLVGTFDAPDEIPLCFGPKYHISNARIERVLSVQEFRSPGELIEWFNSKSH